MDEWAQEFRYWTTKEEEFQEFAQQLCREFRNWKTAEEECEEFAESFLTQRLPELPSDILRTIRSMVGEYQKKKQYLPFGIVNGPKASSHSLGAWGYHIRQNSTCGRGHAHISKGI